jgi:mRNA-degrading endonuclease toxin of MazEF toxin-antitoxin module
VPKILQGSIVRAMVRDPAGGNPKIRPLVIVSANSDIGTSNSVFAVAITSQFREPLPSDEVALPWHLTGKSRTGLTKPCVAKCSWICELDEGTIVESRGHVPNLQLEEILVRVSNLRRS